MKPTYQDLENQTTELKKQNEILKLSEYSDKISDNKYRKMIGNIGDVIVIIDSEGLNKYKSPNIEKSFGWKPEDVIGKSAFENVHSEDLEFAQKFIGRLISNPNVVKTTEIRYKCKDGSYKWIEFTCCNFIRDPEINGLLGNYHDITERKQAEEKLKQQEEKFRAIFVKNSAAIAILNPDTTISMVNEAYCKLSGYTQEEVEGKSWAKQISPDDLERLKGYNNLRITNPKEAPGQYEFKFLRKDGAVKNVVISVSVIASTKIIIASFLDITERMQAEEKIKQQSLDMEFLNSMAIPLADKSTINDFSKILIKKIKKRTGAVLAVFSFYDSDKKEILPLHLETEQSIFKIVVKIAGEKIIKTASPVDDETYKLIIKKIVGTCHTFTEVSFGAIPGLIDKALRASTGIDRIYPIAHVIEGELYGTSVLAFKKGQPSPSIELLKSYAHLMSVSLRRNNAEKALKESENRFRILFEQSTDGIIIHETNLNLLYCNKAIINILELKSKTDFTKLNILDLSPKFQENNTLSADIAPKHVENCLKFGQTRFEWIYKKRNGNLMIFDIILTKIKYKDKTTIHALWRDITAIKKHEKELIVAKEKAEESDRLKSAFLANMSHEIRTPMNGILGFTELLQDTSLSVENQKDYIEIIKKSSDRLLNTVNDIVEISKIESGDINIIKSEVNIIRHLDTLVSFFRPEAEKKSIEIVVQNNVAGNNLMISTDKTKLSSILSNLIKNAIKYTNDGTIKVGIKIENGQILFSCQDSGIGIPTNRHEAIFNRFEQADIDDKQAHQGSGLGLAIVKSYVEVMNGEIWIKSEEARGSIFYVSFPYNPIGTEKQEISKKGKTVDFKKKNINVLIVEDDEISSIYLSFIASEIVKNVRSVHNGVEAVKACENDSAIDLILMDIKMSEMGGYEATKRIREFNKDVVIIAQTAYALGEDKQKALDAGCNDYISKPIKKDKLSELISKYF